MTLAIERPTSIPEQASKRANFTAERLIDSFIAGPKDELLPVGMVSEMYTPSPFASTSFRDDKEELRGRIQKMNFPAYIRENFFREGIKANGSEIHKVTELNDGGRISFMQPTSPYGEIDLLITAIPGDFDEVGMKREDDQVVPYSLMELPNETRFVYNSSQIRVLQSMHHTVEAENRKGENKKAMIMQNSLAVLAPDTSMSIGVTHAHATVHNLNNFVAREGELPGASQEDGILQDKELAQTVLPRLERSTVKHLEANGFSSKGLTMKQREAAPYGFSIVFGGTNAITIDNAVNEDSLRRLHLAKEAIYKRYEMVASILRSRANENDPSYAKHGLTSPNDITGQPSLQEVIDVTSDGLVRITFSPILMTRRGPVEKCDVELARKHEDRLRPSSEEEARINGDYKAYSEAGNTLALAIRGELDTQVEANAILREEKLRLADRKELEEKGFKVA